VRNYFHGACGMACGGPTHDTHEPRAVSKACQVFAFFYIVLTATRVEEIAQLRKVSQCRPVILPFYVPIISSRASNSCPQAVQWMQSDSTTSSSN
jgi:hypothetical protein